jgi:RNA polymerase sigma factor (sigma-70 family)
MDLLQRFAHGEIDAFETLVRQFQGDIYAWTVRIVRDPGTAEDLTVETLWRVYRARHKFRPDGNFGAWARRIATNLAIDHLRRNRPEQSLTAEPAGVPQLDLLVQSETHARIQQAFRRLPAKLQVAATLALVRGASVRRNCQCSRNVSGCGEAARVSSERDRNIDRSEPRNRVAYAS